MLRFCFFRPLADNAAYDTFSSIYTDFVDWNRYLACFLSHFIDLRRCKTPVLVVSLHCLSERKLLVSGTAC